MNRKGFALSEWEEMVLTLLEAFEVRLGRSRAAWEARASLSRNPVRPATRPRF